MSILEAEVAKVQLGTAKSSSTAVSLLAEVGSSADLELFGICELPVFNPAALVDSQRLSEAFFASLRRSFKHSQSSHTFENALSDINQSLLAASGQQKLSGFVDRINACVAVRQLDTFHVAVSGDVWAMLLRRGEWQEIVKMHPRGIPEKTFTSFSSGKLRPGDYMVLATDGLMRCVSLDRLAACLEKTTLPEAGRELVKILEDIGESGAAFGALLIRFVDATAIQEASELPSKDQPASSVSGLSSSRSVWAFIQSFGKIASFVIEKLKEFVIFLRPRALAVGKHAARLSRTTANVAGGKAAVLVDTAGRKLSKFSFRAWTIISVSFLILIAAASLFVWRQKTELKQQQASSHILSVLERAQIELNEADSRQIYGDEASARIGLTRILESINSLGEVAEEYAARVNELLKNTQILADKLDKNLPNEARLLGSLANADRLLVFSDSLVTATDSASVSFNLSTNQAIEQEIGGLGGAVASVVLPSGNVLVYNGDSLRVWTSFGGSIHPLGQETFERIPKISDFGGIAVYPTNNRAYLADNSTKSIIRYDIVGDNLSKPQTWNSTALPESVNDIAVDGSVYILSASGLSKFHQGKLVSDFVSNGVDLSKATRVLAGEKLPFIYVLDSVNQRIIILNKKGSSLGALKNEILKSANDFVVSESGREAFILSSGSLYKLNWTMP